MILPLAFYYSFHRKISITQKINGNEREKSENSEIDDKLCRTHSKIVKVGRSAMYSKC
jgi:hypothetical protein